MDIQPVSSRKSQVASEELFGYVSTPSPKRVLQFWYITSIGSVYIFAHILAVQDLSIVSVGRERYALDLLVVDFAR
jgi:hypothetical protein